MLPLIIKGALTTVGLFILSGVCGISASVANQDAIEDACFKACLAFAGLTVLQLLVALWLYA